jgi:hypothetical protein
MGLMMMRANELLRIAPGAAARLEYSTYGSKLADSLFEVNKCGRVFRTVGEKFSTFIGFGT